VDNYSRSALLEFLDYLAQKGLMKRGTVSSRKAACNNMLGILEEDEASDLRKIDLESVANRFATLKGANYTPDSLQIYRSRVGSAVSDFLRYRENPATFKVKSGTRTSAPQNKAGNSKADEQKPTPKFAEPTPNDADVETINIPIPVRPGCIAYVNGLPTDLSKAEARKFANVILAFAGEEPE